MPSPPTARPMVMALTLRNRRARNRDGGDLEAAADHAERITDAHLHVTIGNIGAEGPKIHRPSPTPRQRAFSDASRSGELAYAPGRGRVGDRLSRCARARRRCRRRPWRAHRSA